jgi:hypothetical protein
MKLLVMINHNGHGRNWSAHIIEYGTPTQDLEVPSNICIRDDSFTDFVEKVTAEMNQVPVGVVNVGLIHVFQLSPPTK